MGILPGTDSEIKMSKSLGNHISILASPEDMYGKVMSIPDDSMYPYLLWLLVFGHMKLMRSCKEWRKKRFIQETRRCDWPKKRG